MLSTALILAACGQQPVQDEPTTSAVVSTSPSDNATAGYEGKRDPMESLALARRTNELATALEECQAGDLPPDAPGAALVWVDHDVAETELKVIRDAIASSGRMTSVDYIDREATEAEVSALYASRPEVLKSTPPDQFPTRFLLGYETVADAKDAATLLTPIPKVQQVVVTTPDFCLAEMTELSQWCRDAGLPDQLMVWLEPGTSDEARAEVADRLLVEPGVVGFVYWDADVTLAEFEQFSAGRDDTDVTIRADDLPTSFRVDLEDGLRNNLDRLTALRRALDVLPGVTSTDIANREFGDHCL